MYTCMHANIQMYMQIDTGRLNAARLVVVLLAEMACVYARRLWSTLHDNMYGVQDCRILVH